MASVYPSHADHNHGKTPTPFQPEFSTAASGGWVAPANSENWSFENATETQGQDGFNSQNDGKDDKCRNCGLEGHFARDCSQPRKMTCYNCGQDGHAKSECTEPKKFQGECRNCGLEDMFAPSLVRFNGTDGFILRHPAAQCPSKVNNCMNCFQEGHTALECKNPKKLDMSKVADKTEEEAWILLGEASEDRNIPDFKEAVKMLSKACPEYTYDDLEKQFRGRGFKIFLIALNKDHGDTWTNVNLQGETGKKYAVGYFYSASPQRPLLAANWPASPEENLIRLADAGTPLERGVDKCANCKELGHLSRACPQEKMVHEQAKISCFLCGEDGHRVRDCTQERPKPRGPRTCKICESEDHIARDCPNQEKRTCRNCGSEDHMAKECDQPRNPETIQCRNCDKFGHTSRDCGEKKDWSRVTCNVCNEKGHGAKRCPMATVTDTDLSGFGAHDHVEASAPGNGWDAPKADNGWATAQSTGGSGWDSNVTATNTWQTEASTSFGDNTNFSQANQAGSSSKHGGHDEGSKYFGGLVASGHGRSNQQF